MSEWLTNGNGKPWMNDKGEKIPMYCQKCGAKVGLYLFGEPVFLCENTVKSGHKIKHYFGTPPLPDDVLECGERREENEVD